MQEIIASISRIIAEDNRATPARTSARGKSGILELTEVIEADGAIRKLDRAGPTISRTEIKSVPAEAATTTMASSAAQTAAPPMADRAHDALLAGATAEATSAAFARLASVAAEVHREQVPALGAGRTLEEIVRDALHPLLRAWLDAHLPDIVERLVQREIDRLVRAARPR